jgi:hypothetical protein
MPFDLLDGTYERLSDTGPEYGGGLSNHGPMAAEALLRLVAPMRSRPGSLAT